MRAWAPGVGAGDKLATDAVVLCLQLTQGVINEAIAKLGHKRRKPVDTEPESRWWPFV